MRPMSWDWERQGDGSYVPTDEGLRRRYVIRRDRENQVYRPEGDGAPIERKTGNTGYFVLREAKRACERHHAASAASAGSSRY